jgi:Flp pilus assembly protein TadB
MSFSDPFNRVSRKREKEYLAFQERLKEAGLDTEEKVTTMLQKSRQTMLGLGAIVVVVTLLGALIWPDQKVIVIVIGSLTLVWLLGIIVRGQRMMKQFIQKEFSGK